MTETVAQAASGAETRSIVVEEIFPHAPVPGTRFTFQTKPAGGWDGTIQCQVLDVVPCERLVYSWKGGHADNIGYGSLLDTIVTWSLSPTEGGTRLRLEHAGFALPRNESAFTTMSSGWKTVVPRIAPLLDQVHRDENEGPAS